MSNPNKLLVAVNTAGALLSLPGLIAWPALSATDWQKYLLLLLLFVSLYYALNEQERMRIILPTLAAFWMFLFALFFHDLHSSLNIAGPIASGLLLLFHINSFKLFQSKTD